MSFFQIASILLFLASFNTAFESAALSENQINRHFDLQISNIVSNGVSRLAHNLGEKILADCGGECKYEVFSPISIAAALHLALLGARASTFAEIFQVFGYSANPILSKNPYKVHDEFSLLLGDLASAQSNRFGSRASWREIFYSFVQNQPLEIQSSDHLISVANGVFVNSGFSLRPDYKMAIEMIYKSHIQSLDFTNNPDGAAQFINGWINAKTHGRVREILNERLPPYTRLILVNALYFKAFWSIPFLEGATKWREFYPNGVHSSHKTVQMMAHGGWFPYYESRELDCRILGLPYKGNQTTMYIILPNNSNRDKLIQTQRLLSPEAIEMMISQMEVKYSIVLFPKLHLNSRYHLNDKLKKLGITSLFQSQRSDLSLISDAGIFPWNDENDKFIWDRIGVSKSPQVLLDLDTQRQRNLINPGLYVEEVLHQVDLTIDEMGTEGGAGTSFGVSKSSQVVFRVNAPFLILIRHDSTRLPLFYGAIFEPGNFSRQ